MKVRAFKFLDKYLGTPICLLLGLVKKLRRGSGLQGEPVAILIIKLVAVGDVVAALPAVRALRRRYPRAHIAMLVTPRVGAVVEGNPDLSEIIHYDICGEHAGVGGFFRLVRSLREARTWDVVVELDQRYRSTSILAYLLHPAAHVGFVIARQGRQGLFDVKVPYRTECHEVDAFLDVAAALGTDRSEADLVPVAYTPADAEAAGSFLAGFGAGADDFVVLVHPGTSGVATERQWPIDRFADTCDWLAHRYNAKVVLTGADENLPLIDKIKMKMKTAAAVAAGRLSMKQFAALAERSSLVLSVDTGALHVAAAMGTPVVGLFGPSTPAKWGPYGSQHKVIYKRLDCSPCAKPYLGQLPRCSDPRCMTQIGVEEVKAVLREKIEQLQAAGEEHAAADKQAANEEQAESDEREALS